MFVVGSRDESWILQSEATLRSQGVDARWVSDGSDGALYLDVPVSDSELVSDLLSEQLVEELSKPVALPCSEAPLFLQPAFAVACGLSAVLLAFFWVTGEFAWGEVWFRRGALVADRVAYGEWWRLVTAATLHVDIQHALSNATFFLVLGWAAAERLGIGVMLLIAVLTAVAGFGTSLTFSETTLTLGASGGLFGLLGVAGGHALRLAPLRDGSARRNRIRAIGAAIMLLAFTAFEPRANIYAHVGGFVSGALAGLALPLRPPRPLFQWLGMLGAIGFVGLAWHFAFLAV